VKDSFYKELECVFDKLLKYHMKILLGDFNAKVGRKDIFKLTIGNESLQEINDNGVILVTPLYPQKLTLTSPTRGGRLVSIVCSRTKAMELLLSYISKLCHI
jgi:hypothetical protein